MRLPTSFSGFSAARILAVILLLNSPMTWTALNWGLSRPFFNLDYLLPIFLARFSAIGAYCLFLILYFIDIISSLSIAYHFDSPSNFIRSANATPAIFKTLISEPSLLSLVVPPVFWLLIAKWLSQTASLRSVCRELIPATCIAIVLVITDIYVGASMLDTSDRPKIGPNIVGSPFASQSKRLLSLERSSAPIPTQATIFDVDRATLFLANEAVTLIIVESMGLPVSQQAQEWLDDMARTAPPNRVTLRHVDFKGATVSAELRHLCANVSAVPDNIAPDQCLPMLARTAHRRSFAAHGNSGITFNRRHWWPSLGFDQVFFREDLLHHNANICDFAYKAVCDHDLIDFIFRTIKPREFVYALTVSTHLPIPKLDSDIPGEFCSMIREREMPCRIIWLQGQVLALIAKKVKNSPIPVTAYVVGDHPPPFLSIENRAAFSATQTIGWKIENTTGLTP